MPNLTPRVNDTLEDRKCINMYKEKIMAGEHRPILIDENNNYIIDGNHTLTAYQELGIEPPLLYSSKKELFEKAVYEALSHNNYKINPGLCGTYILIREGMAKKL